MCICICTYPKRKENTYNLKKEIKKNKNKLRK